MIPDVQKEEAAMRRGMLGWALVAAERNITA
jgi:hypothetical protein